MTSLRDLVDPKDCKSEEILLEKLSACKAHLKLLSLHRRQILNDYLDLKGNIRVFCRIRPPLPRQSCQKQSIINSDDRCVLIKVEKKRKRFKFDQVFQYCSTQEEVFSEVEPVIKSALDGYNVCIFAYGQTGTGKTYTMEGRSDSPGVVPQVLSILFDKARSVNHKLTFSFSMLEIYMGRLRDLLVPQKARTPVRAEPCLSIQMDHGGGIEIENLTCIRISDFDQVKGLYRLGSQLRSTASTMSNATSSRSHCLMRILVSSDSTETERQRETNKIWMIDLGGSERLLKTQAKGKRLEEGKAINLSLSALGDVISSLHNKKNHVPYRNSKLTQVLSDSLGKDSKTLMIVHVSPNEEDLRETLCSLGFATRVQSIHLGQDEPVDMKARNELLMAEMLHKLNQLESESQHAIRDIRQLNEHLTSLSKKFIKPVGDELQDIKAEDEKFSMRTSHISSNAQGTSTNPPRFMRPTICSDRKVRTNPLPGSTRKKQRVTSREAAPNNVQPVAYNMEGLLHLDQGSRERCMLGHLDGRHDTDIETESSQDISECDVKQVIFMEQQQMIEMFGKCQKEKVCQNQSLDPDDWIVFQSGELKTPCNLLSKRTFTLYEKQQYISSSKEVSKAVNCEMNIVDAHMKENDFDSSHKNLYTTAKEQRIKGDTPEEESFTGGVSNTDILTSRLSAKDSNGQQMIESTQMNIKSLSEGESGHELTSEKSELGKEHTTCFDPAGDKESLVSKGDGREELGKIFENSFECGQSVEENQNSSVLSERTCSSLLWHNDPKTTIHKVQNIEAVPESGAVPSTIPKQANQGMCQFFHLIASILHVISLLGLGSQSLACNDDFIHGLML